MGQAAPSCHLSWNLLAAVGAAQSNHGRRGGAALNRTGVVKPSLFGSRTTGRGAGDSDAGRLDHDRHGDRPMGPMMFLPSTWTTVGVDGDQDGRRSPQDIDDAALAAAVYLCSGSGDLSTDHDARRALRRFDRAPSYADAVLALAETYAEQASARVTQISGPTLLAEADFAVVRRPRVSARSSEPDPAPGGPTLVRPGATPDPERPTPAKTSKPYAPDPSGEPTKAGEPAPQPAPATVPGADPTPEATPTATTTPAPAFPTPTPTVTDPTPAVTDPTAPTPNTPTPNDPTPTPALTDPAPSNPAEPAPAEPTLSAQASPDPTPSDPTPTQPALSDSGSPVSREGAWAVGDEGFLLDGALVALDGDQLAAPVPTDLDGDGTAETLRDELTGLVGTHVVLLVQASDGRWILDAVNGASLRP
jgi:hypothetical protein